MTADFKARALFIEKVMARLKVYIDLYRERIEEWCEVHDYRYWSPEASFPIFESHLARLYDLGFSEDDAFRYLTWCEDVDPRIPEKSAVESMSRMLDKYRVPVTPAPTA